MNRSVYRVGGVSIPSRQIGGRGTLALVAAFAFPALPELARIEMPGARFRA